MTRRIKDYEVSSIKYDLDGKTLPEAIKSLKELLEHYGSECVIDIGQEYEPYDYQGERYAYVRLMGKREENDEEYEKRIADEKRYADQRAKADMEAYERVRKQLENK